MYQVVLSGAVIYSSVQRELIKGVWLMDIYGQEMTASGWVAFDLRLNWTEATAKRVYHLYMLDGHAPKKWARPHFLILVISK